MDAQNDKPGVISLTFVMEIHTLQTDKVDRKALIRRNMVFDFKCIHCLFLTLNKYEWM